MKCEKCGKPLEYVEVSMFNHDGTDDWYDAEIGLDCGIAYINILPNWTGNDLSEEEMAETIRCPHCHKYPFVDKEIHADDYVTVTMFPRENAVLERKRKMKLINAEYLKKYIRETGIYCDTDADKEFSCKVIDSMPEVEAIPVSFIEERIAKLEADNLPNRHARAIWYSVLMDDWRKKNETD